jgi:hypothetical protein
MKFTILTAADNSNHGRQNIDAGFRLGGAIVLAGRAVSSAQALSTE